MNRLPEVVVSGIGVISSIGVGHEQFWQALLEGRNGFRPVQSFDTSRYPVHIGAEIVDFDPQPFLTTLKPDEVGRASQLAIAAARLAITDSSGH